MPTLDFSGKHFIYSHHLTVPCRTLEVDAAKSLQNPHFEGGVKSPSLEDNLIIHGDNLHALKALLPKYAGKIKCIYIDPPYNTGNEGWVYNDNVNSPLMQRWLTTNSPIDIEDLERHDKWLCMMWPRLQLLRELLADDGVMFISIDDNEVHLLRAIMDEIFDAQRMFPAGNFVGQFVWAAGRKNNAKLFSNSHDYILCYLKNHECLNQSGTTWRVRKQGLDDIYKKHAALQRKHGQNFAKIETELAAWFKGLPDGHPAKRHSGYRYVDSRGPYSSSDTSAPGGNGERYPILHPITSKPCAIPAGGWRYTQQEMKELIAADRVQFGVDETSVPRRKLYLKETEYEVPYSVFYKDGQGTTKRLRRLLGQPFPFPKDEEVLKLLFEAVTGPNDIVLDSFAGSGTTAHAVLALNKDDGGNRKFILIECEDYAHHITAERIRRVINGTATAKDATLRQGLGGSFTYCELGEPIDEEGMLSGETLPAYETLANYIAYVATGSSLEGIARHDDYLFGETDARRFYLIYEPSLAFLESNAAALDGHRAAQIAAQCKKDGKKAYVWGAQKLMSQRDLTAMGITFCQLPYNIHRMTDE